MSSASARPTQSERIDAKAAIRSGASGSRLAGGKKMLLMRARVDMTPTFYFSMNAGVAECDMTPLPQDDSKTGVSMSGARRHDVAGGIQLHKGAPRTWLNSR